VWLSSLESSAGKKVCCCGWGLYFVSSKTRNGVTDTPKQKVSWIKRVYLKNKKKIKMRYTPQDLYQFEKDPTLSPI
jgi:hypothetical protein